MSREHELVAAIEQRLHQVRSGQLSLTAFVDELGVLAETLAVVAPETASGIRRTLKALAELPLDEVPGADLHNKAAGPATAEPQVREALAVLEQLLQRCRP